MINIPAIERTVPARVPFSFFVAQDVLEPEALQAVREDFPAIDRPGLFPLSTLSYGPSFAALIDELLSPEVERAIGAKLGVDLAGRARMVTVRGRCRERDGRIHTDNADKLAAALLYLNDAWDAEGGRLRLLRSEHDLDDVIAEVPPRGGTLLAFKRSPNSWHGHKPFAGERRYVMVNWMAQPASAERELMRHSLTARAKSLASRWL